MTILYERRKEKKNIRTFPVWQSTFSDLAQMLLAAAALTFQIKGNVAIKKGSNLQRSQHGHLPREVRKRTGSRPHF